MEIYFNPKLITRSLALSLLVATGSLITANAQENTVCVNYNIPSLLPVKVLFPESTFISKGNGYDWSTMTALGVNTAPFADIFDPNETDGYYSRIIDMMGHIFPGSNEQENAERLRSIDIVVGGEQIESIFASRHGSTGTTPLSYRCIDSSGQVNVSADTIAFRANNSPYTELVLEEVAQVFALHASVTNYNTSEKWRETTGIHTVEQLVSAEEQTGFRFVTEMLQHGLIKSYIEPDWNGMSQSSYELNVNGVAYTDPLAANAALTELFNSLIADTGITLSPEQMLLHLADPTGNLWINQLLDTYYGLSIYDLVGGRRVNNQLSVVPVSLDAARAMRIPTTTPTNTSIPSATSTQTNQPTITATPTATATNTIAFTNTVAATSTSDITPTLQVLFPTMTVTVTQELTQTPSPSATTTPEGIQPVIVSPEDLKELADRTALALSILCISGFLLGGISLGGGILISRRGNYTSGSYKLPKQKTIKPLKPTSRGVKKIPPRR